MCAKKITTASCVQQGSTFLQKIREKNIRGVEAEEKKESRGSTEHLFLV